ncbi:MAG: isoprenyl transferase [Planctomycetota bacterium]|nr:isoprenyl transferase [Planctomycetota bacterium]MDG2144583.1 isoprenyl transferase [Planctomycetota bacterium]
MASATPRSRSSFGAEFPDHIAIIMDGNGRWAKSRGWKRVRGHQEGVNSVRAITTECARLGVQSLTLYAFSVENWKRPKAEINFLMKLLRSFLVDERPTLMENNIRLHCIGRLDDLPAESLKELRETEAMTKDHDGMVLRLALSYGSRSELADAARAMAEDVQAGKLEPSAIHDETLREYLYDPSTPDPDLLIRTAGEMRLSNFLLWQISYAEFFVAAMGWPEFREDALHVALDNYGGRTRKFGGLVSDVAPETPAPTQGR